MREFIAKSKSKESIYLHTDRVVENIIVLCKKYNISDKDMALLINAAILHDIGKMTKNMQNYLHDDTKEKFKFTHNITGWFFITKYVNIDDSHNIARYVLWHHANNDSCSDLSTKQSEIRKEISSEDLENMKLFCKHYNIKTHIEEIEDSCYDNEFYRLNNLLRSILVASDVCASSGENVLELFEHEKISFESLNKKFINSDRTIGQIEIVNKTKEGSTTLIKAPTGFGKTILGILFAISRKGSIPWVCPTNIIASSIYHEVIKALEMMGLDISVELYLTGEKKEGNSNVEDFKSKIIITNIDNFTKPTVSNSYGNRCLMIYESSVIFDEPHEYDKMNCALNASYNDIMNLRHNTLNSTTLQLTATPPTPRFIRVEGKEINYLPNKETHYSAAHRQNYKLIFHESIPDLPSGEFIFFSHTVEEAQDLFLKFDGPALIAHGKYTDEYKEIMKNLVLNNYSKNGLREECAVFTNQFLTTACDYSIKTMYIKCPTCDDLFQALGRINRFGGMGDCNIHIILEKSKADEVHIGNEDDNLLQENFINELMNQKSIMNLDEMYIFLNQFNDRHKKLRNSISKESLDASKNMLKYIFPKSNKNNKNEIKIANGNKMRHSPVAEGKFISVKKFDSNDFVTINFNVNKKMGFSKTFGEDEKTYKKQLKDIKKRKYFNKHAKITPELVMKQAIFYDTPYIVYNHEFHPILGLFKNTQQRLELIKNKDFTFLLNLSKKLNINFNMIKCPVTSEA